MSPTEISQIIQFIVKEGGGSIGGLTFLTTIALMFVWYAILKPFLTRTVSNIADNKIKSVIDITKEIKTEVLKEIAQLKSTINADHEILISLKSDFNNLKELTSSNINNLSERVRLQEMR